ncbi:replication-relaxation family protein [Actinomadura terrae]|uniref:replication-relaxation family protein n=1 Tax=Actinomadura terrae TaxID=604353 RepID=UPI001FA7A155|nr:replication-relaxation family protein [Actinomadura terrae]
MKKTIRHRQAPTTPRRATPELFLELCARLTDRDHAILELVWEHRVLTTHQLAAIFFSTPGKARDRLLQLFRLKALERFQPWVPVGAAPYHWVLGPLGAQRLAAHRDTTLAGLGYRRTTALQISHSRHLAHQVGVNEFFTQLHAHARHTTEVHLDKWWPERRCTQLWGDLARPDAYGRWTETTREQQQPTTVDFFLEHDTGSVTLAKVAAKLNGYEALSEATGITTPVLFWLPSTRREAHLRALLGTPPVPVATAVHTPADTTTGGPAGPIWLPARQDGPRHRLIDLASTSPHSSDAYSGRMDGDACR